ncbi:MvdC/MvdD family ATP grasp protein [Alkalimonas mucilaginosa]|uniref:MvdD-like pre-ATP grasp domain-containing protein n=1 Tax=Alkalimonas mucilaginosa TaxID=3057676 RepID=A0ABU7JEF6_9GAMM|nr:hypothetical protein [Alkalimonas sp. MEB004]MEE2024072.1 hypothetical protein [Alkalimonas sp. MEB004]
MSPEVIILARESDMHASVVSKALTATGKKNLILPFYAFPTAMCISFEFDADGSSVANVFHGENRVCFESVSRVWFRRDVPAKLHPTLLGDDREFARRECGVVISGLEGATEKALWVNPRSAALASENKVYQLKLAQVCGFKIPKTLISNDPGLIRKFVIKQDSVYKSLAGYVWDDGVQRTATYTRQIHAQDLKEDSSLQNAPGIFQELIVAEYEVRVFVCGETCLAVRIVSNVQHDSIRDWRLHQDTHLKASRIEIPLGVREKCLKIMAMISLVTASFDFMVDMNGCWCFLELNSSGQFLFLEEWCPDLPVLATFCSFLSDTARGRQREIDASIKLSDFV